MQLGTPWPLEAASCCRNGAISGCPFANPKDCPFYEADGLPHAHKAAPPKHLQPQAADQPSEPVYAPVVCLRVPFEWIFYILDVVKLLLPSINMFLNLSKFFPGIFLDK